MQNSQTPWPNFRVKTHSDTLSYSICRSNEGMQLIDCNAIVPFGLAVVTGVRGPRRAITISLQMTKVYAVHHHLTSTFEQTTINQSINQLHISSMVLGVCPRRSCILFLHDSLS